MSFTKALWKVFPVEHVLRKDFCNIEIAFPQCNQTIFFSINVLSSSVSGFFCSSAFHKEHVFNCSGNLNILIVSINFTTMKKLYYNKVVCFFSSVIFSKQKTSLNFLKLMSVMSDQVGDINMNVSENMIAERCKLIWNLSFRSSMVSMRKQFYVFFFCKD